MSDAELEFLHSMNVSELVQIARGAGLGNLPRDKELLVEAILASEPTGPDTLEERRARMQAHIREFRQRLLSQLPGCNGCCTTYGCPDLIVTRCWSGFSRDML